MFGADDGAGAGGSRPDAGEAKGSLFLAFSRYPNE
jgi:hypothetical protein